MSTSLQPLEWHEIRQFPATHEDGHDAVVSVMRMPAEFYRIEAPDLAIDLMTGSPGMQGLAESIATAIADGMLVRCEA